MKIIKLFCIITLCCAFNIHSMLRSTITKRSVEQAFKKILTEEEKFFYKNQNELAMSKIRVHEEKKNFYKEQAEYTKFKKNVFKMLVGAALMIDIGNIVLGLKDVNGLPMSGPITSMLVLPSWLLHSVIYKNNELALKAYKERIK